MSRPAVVGTSVVIDYGDHEAAVAALERMASPIDEALMYDVIRAIWKRGHQDLASGLTTPGLGHGFEITLAGAITEEYNARVRDIGSFEDDDAEGERRFLIPINPDPMTRRIKAEKKGRAK